MAQFPYRIVPLYVCVCIYVYNMRHYRCDSIKSSKTEIKQRKKVEKEEPNEIGKKTEVERDERNALYTLCPAIKVLSTV